MKHINRKPFNFTYILYDQLYYCMHNECFCSFRYLFGDIAAYINTVIKPHFNDRYTCLTFTWAPQYSQATEHLKASFKHLSLNPSVIILNMGLHIPQASLIAKGYFRLHTHFFCLFLLYSIIYF